MPEPEAAAVATRHRVGCWPTPSCASALGRAGIDDRGRLRLGAADRRAGGFLTEVAAPRRMRASTDVVPDRSGRRRAPDPRPPMKPDVRRRASCAARSAAAIARSRCRPGESDEREVREGTLRCSACGAEQFRSTAASPSCSSTRPSTSSARRRGWSASPSTMRADGWDREMIRALPDIERRLLVRPGASINQLLHDRSPFSPGESLLDVGSNTCWAANHFACADCGRSRWTSPLWRCRACTPPTTSSRTAPVLRARARLDGRDAAGVEQPRLRLLLRGPAPQRPRGPAADVRGGLPGAEARRHAAGGQRDAQDAARPASASTSRASTSSRATSTPTGRCSYRWGRPARASLTQVIEPHYHRFFGDPPRPQTAPPLRDWRSRLPARAARRARGAQAYLAWLNHVAGGAQFGMIAVEAGAAPRTPQSPRGRSEVLGDVRRRPVEHPEAEREHRRPRSRAASAGQSAPPSAWPALRRGVGDHRVAELLEDHAPAG